MRARGEHECEDEITALWEQGLAWLRDAGVDPASPVGPALSEQWLDFLDDAGPRDGVA